MSGVDAPDAADESGTGEGSDGSQEILEDALEDALDFLEGLLAAMDSQGEVGAEITEEGGIVAWIEGDDVGALIGSRGQTLDAIQELLRSVVQRQAQTRVPVLLDVEGYRQRRREAVRREAELMIRKALDEGEAQLPTMSAYDRKTVHEMVAATEGVSSFSEGQDPARRVRILRDD